uniref:Putative secreted protein n=1 Tax=Ixodes ricinus TaxID=34613 RepID=A0A147BQK2_IXORI
MCFLGLLEFGCVQVGGAWQLSQFLCTRSDEREHCMTPPRMLYSRCRRARRALPDGGDYPEAHARAPHSGIRGSWGQCGARGAHFCDLNLPFLPRVVCCPRFPVLVCIFNVRALDWAIVRVDVDCSEDVLPPLGLSLTSSGP